MGGIGPGIGGLELLLIGIVALLVVGPKDLPLLMRRVGQFVGKARAMANEFRASFDDLARESELEELRNEVKALRSGSGVYALGADAENAFKDIRTELEAPLNGASQISVPQTALPETALPETALAETAVPSTVGPASAGSVRDEVAPIDEAVPESLATGVDEWPDLDAQAAQVEQLIEEEAGKKPQ